jgi:macrolide phosphotransferase
VDGTVTAATLPRGQGVGALQPSPLPVAGLAGPYGGGVPARSPLVLAALASAAVPDLEPAAARDVVGAGETEDVDVAEVTDTQGRRWVVRAPRTSAAGAVLEQEWRLLARLTDPPDQLPFAVPQIAGTVELPDGGRAGVHPALPGSPLRSASLTPGPGLAAALGRAVAAVHDLPTTLAEEAELPVYTAAEYRHRRLAEVDRAAATGHVPPGLLTRWERALEEAGAWRFTACVVHGDLAAESVLVADGEVVAVLDWGQARVADPADDLAVLVAGAPEEATESVLEAYAHHRRSAPDRDLLRRARLSGELAVARWLLHGVTSADETVVADAVAMLGDLEAAVDGSPW